MKCCIRVLTFVFLVVAITGCATPLPEPTKSQYFETDIGAFSMESGKGVQYLMIYKPIAPIENTLYGKILFENPTDESAPLVVDIEVGPGQDDLMVESEVIGKIENNRNYEVRFDLFETPERTDTINTHVDLVRFSVPKQLITELGIDVY